MYSYFAFPEIERHALFAFMAPDLLVISALSLVVCRRPNPILQACILGGFAFGALWCAGASYLTGGGFLSTTVMTLGALFNVMLLLGQGVFRTSRTAHRGMNLAKTLLQTIVIWTITLVVIPLVIVHASGEWPPHLNPVHVAVGAAGLLLFSAFGVWSGLVMAVRGGGTPLPLDAPRRLVVAGPYAYIRNPMAMSGLGQGFSVAIVLSSIAVAAYVAVGLFVWNYIVRPEEERFMRKVFKTDFERYRSNVGCWIPRKRRFQW